MIEQSATERLAERYPPPDRRRRLIRLTAVIVAVVMALAWYLLVSLRLATPAIDARLTSFEVIDARTVDVTLTVTRRDPHIPAACQLYASASDDQAVGEAPIEIGPDDRSTIIVTGEVRTYQKASNAHLGACTLHR